MESVNDLFQEVYQDRSSGSSTLLENTVNAFEQLFEEKKEEPQLAEALRKKGREVVEKRPHFATLFHFVNELLLTVEKTEVGSLPETIQGFLDDYRQKREESKKKIVRQCRERLFEGEEIVLLHSQSGTILQLFQTLKDEISGLRIIQTESRPGYEGRQQARKLADIGHPVTLIVDAAVYQHLSDIDRVLLGADALTENTFVNKIGSSMIALAARDKKIPVHVVTDKTKLVPNSLYRMEASEHPPEEVWDDPPPGVTPQNDYFEKIPLKFLKSVILESGVYGPAEIEAIQEEQPIAKSLQH